MITLDSNNKDDIVAIVRDMNETLALLKEQQNSVSYDDDTHKDYVIKDVCIARIYAQEAYHIFIHCCIASVLVTIDDITLDELYRLHYRIRCAFAA